MLQELLAHCPSHSGNIFEQAAAELADAVEHTWEQVAVEHLPAALVADLKRLDPPFALGTWRHLQLTEYLLCEMFKVVHPDGRTKRCDGKSSPAAYAHLLEQTRRCCEKCLAMQRCLRDEHKHFGHWSGH